MCMLRSIVYYSFIKLKVMKMFYDDFEVGDTIGFNEIWVGGKIGNIAEHVLTEETLNNIKIWEKEDNEHNMRIIKKRDE